MGIGLEAFPKPGSASAGFDLKLELPKPVPSGAHFLRAKTPSEVRWLQAILQ